jgi:predicted DNA-binding transcriptional regulator AlpA
MEYTFTLRYQLNGVAADSADMVERLGAEECTDALVGVGLAGQIALAFVRVAESAEAAVLSAMESVQRAVPGARMIEVAPDLVGLTDVAALAGVTRQNVRKLMLSHSATFPVPVHAGSASLWHAADVLLWLREHFGYVVPESTLEVVRMAERVNAAKSRHRLSDRVCERLAALV